MPYSLKNLFNLENLRGLLETLQSITGIACGLMDSTGELIVSSSFTPLCKRLCDHRAVATHVCAECRNGFARAAEGRLQAVEKQCDYGLSQAVAPLVVGGEYLGAVILGQVFLQPPDLQDLQGYQELIIRNGFDQAAFMADLNAVPVIAEEQFHKSLKLVTGLATMLADQGAARFEARKAAERLRESELFLNMSQQIAQVGGWKANLDTNQLQWTGQVYDMLELPFGTQVTLEYAEQTFLASNQEQLQRDMSQAWESDYNFVTECELQSNSGKRFWGEFRCVGRLEMADGTWLVGTLQEITLRKEAEKEMLRLLHRAEEASCLKSQLLANLSHELRTPLNGVLGCAQLLGMSKLNSEQEKYIGLIDSSVSRELLLIENLLEQSRLESGDIVITRSPCLLGQCVYEAVAVFQRAVREKGLSLTVTVSPELNQEVLADKGRIRQILAALLDNSLKFTSKGKITVSCCALRQKAGSLLVSFTVGDTGIGIGKDALAHVFDPFTQEDMSNTREYGGMGLGLSICRSLAQAMGGRIWAESKPGSGSLFNLDLPLELVGSLQSLSSPNDSIGGMVLEPTPDSRLHPRE